MPRTAIHRAFTLMELLIVVTIIALLVGIVAVSIRGVRAAASRTNSLGALRQMGMGYSMYSQDNNSQLLPGYIGAALFGPTQPFVNMSVSLSSGDPLTIVDMQSYVWRLAPYVDDNWQTFFEDTSDAGAMAEFTADYQRMTTPGGGHAPGLISEHPSFGLNSIFVGGDSVHGGVGNHHPWKDSLPPPSGPPKAATRLTHVVNPTKLIVFAPTAEAAANAVDVYTSTGTGFCELRAPYLDRPSVDWTNRQWLIGANGRVTQAPTGSFGAGGGLPIARTAKEILDGGKEPMPVVHLDASTDVQPPVELSDDMRSWSQRKDVQ